jgi:hypothetical protein
VLSGAAYSQAFVAQGGVGALTLSEAGSIAPLTFVANTGVLSGNAGAPGVLQFSITAADSIGDMLTQYYTLTIAARPAQIVVQESIHVTDADTVEGPALVADTETIHVTDTDTVLGAAVVTDTESIRVTDADTVLGAASVIDTESIHVTDADTVLGPTLVTDTESIHVTEADQLPQPQTISFGRLANKTFGAAAFNVGATASSGLTVTFTSTTPAVCAVAGSTVTIETAGMCSITASQAGNAGAAPATPVAQSFTIAQATAVVTWDPPAAITFGGALGPGQLDATANVPGTFVYTPAVGTVLPVGNGQTLAAAFTPADTVDYISATATTTITVNPAPPPATPANLVVTKTLTRSGGNVVAQITLANTGGTAAANVVLSSGTVGSDKATPLPQSIGTIAAGASAVATVTVPGSVGVSGAASSLTLGGTYTGGTFSSSGRITLP